jgi:N-acetylmuramoyl-L-alanine amidase
MSLSSRIRLVLIIISVLTLVGVQEMYGQQKKFVLVLDAGHGGRDAGAVGRISQEKNINLSVAKLVGSMIESNLNDVKVVYTRKTDVFLPLEERAQIANNNHADMFISIHTNAAKSKSAYGAETFVLGLAKTKANLDVAMAENSVILLEDDYQTRYRGFDPNSVDSYIMFEFMMDKYLESSVLFATEIQKQFTGYAKRLDRGVRQAGFWVLHRTASPSVLIELGFISNYNEELYLASERGQQELAKAIYNAFVLYKRDHDKKLGYNSKSSPNVPVFERVVQEPVGTDTAAGVVSQLATEPENVSSQGSEAPKNSAAPVFKLQIRASDKELKTNSPEFKGLKNVVMFREAGMYKYTVGNDTDLRKIQQLKRDLQSKFPDAFIIAFHGDKKISVNEALKLTK